MPLPAISNRTKALFLSSKNYQNRSPSVDASFLNNVQRQSRHVRQPDAATNESQPSFRSWSRTAATPPAAINISPRSQQPVVADSMIGTSPRPSLRSDPTYSYRTHNVESHDDTFTDSVYESTKQQAKANNISQTEGDSIAEEKHKAEKAFKELASRGRMSIPLSSKEFTYTPRCDKDTLRALCVRILEWGRSEGEVQCLHWLSGLAGVGKMAVVWTVAKELKREGLLGARFSFSRYNNQTDPDLVIPTLAYRLALISPEFKKIVAQSLVKDPLIFYRSRRFQFRELIINPFLSLTSQPKTPLLIILDGLDECNDRQAQREFVEMINHHIQTEGSRLRLRWLISSRPEPHLRDTFSTPECKVNCLHEELEAESEALKDARRRLEKGLKDIRRRYPDRLTQDWPDKSAIRFIASRLSGHADGVPVILQYIGDQHHDDPSGQLDFCLRLFEGTGSGFHSLHALDLLYTQILSNVPESLLPTTQRILGLLVFYDHETLPALVHANFLEIDQPTFYQALERLRLVLVVPAVSEAAEKPIRTYRTSFTSYLKDQARSGRFALDEGASHLDVAMQGLRWLCHSRKGHSASGDIFGSASCDIALLPLRSSTGSLPPPMLAWIPPNTITKSVLDILRRFSFTHCWKACTLVPEGYQGVLMGGLDDFDFNLDYRKWWPHETHDFAHFIRWLISVGAVYTELIVLDYWNTKRGVPKRRRRLSIWHQDADPEAFVEPFLEGETWAPDTAVHLQLGRFKSLSLSLHVGTSVSPSFLPAILC
ncbi:hypothetical protein D9756_008785 [Leucocoprinus leucothites]|uniref:Nephrocystin 3-like N-terminal domain-containing protein n=1 Tax=Leucocoprinus leucothites TaxID=201217 RepID=A0A8H5CWX9_9AGAR|nr:hypothetical protein D9756_008785 [Leucoagaricus leucothites]